MDARRPQGCPGLWLRLLLTLWVTAAARPTFAADSVDALVATALDQNPQLTAIEAQIAALEHKTTQAGAWQNPKFQVAYQNAPVDSFAMGVEPMTMVSFRLEQTIPFPGKNGDRRDVVRKASEAKRWELEEKRIELGALVETAYYRLALARHLRELTAEHVSLVAQLVDAVRIKYEVGRAAQENLLRLEVLRDRLTDDLEDFTRQDRELTSVINGALHRDIHTPVETPDVLSVAPPTHSLEGLMAMAAESRPVLKQLDATTEMHRAAAEQAEYDAIPDPTLFAAYGIRAELPGGNPGRDLVTIGLGLPLPIFYAARNGAQASESREQARSTVAGRDAMLDNIASGLEQALAGWARAASKVQSYRDKLVPDAHRTLDATFASYQVDRAEFLSLYEAELDLLNFEKTIRVATVESLVARAMVERTIGRKLP